MPSLLSISDRATDHNELNTTADCFAFTNFARINWLVLIMAKKFSKKEIIEAKRYLYLRYVLLEQFASN